MLVTFERAFGAYLAVLADRTRATLWRWRGAKLGRRSRIGRHCFIVRPWCLVAGQHLQVEHHVYLKITSDDAQVRLGDRVFLGRGAELDISDCLTVGDDVLIAPGCFITDHQHRHELSDRIAAQGCRSAPIVIEDDVWLGANCVVLPGTRIESGAIVGAGAVVTRNVSAKAIVAGVPARVIGSRGQGR